MSDTQKSDSDPLLENISLCAEAYEYLRSIKSEQESFSDVILKLKKERRITGTILAESLKTYTPPTNKYVMQQEKSLRATKKQLEQEFKKLRK